MRYDEWTVADFDRPAAVRLVHAGANPLVAAVLASRGAADLEKLKMLSCSDISLIPDPMLMRDMDKAAERLKLAISGGESVAVFGDYDVDGITASCVISQYLRSKGVECRLMIPETREEGYGLSKTALSDIRDGGAALVVTVDCGITSVEEAEYAKELGLDVIITDHHECGASLPEAAAVVDPKRPDCEYPEKILAGVGVAFSLVCACEGRENTARLLEEYGDLVALGTLADMMPVTGVNRVLIKNGISLMQNNARPGIRMLAAESGIDMSQLTSASVCFTLAPRLNAAGRMGKTSVAVKLMTSETETEASEYSVMLCELNSERRRIESEMFEEALSMAEAENGSRAPIVLSSEKWYLGVAGIVASRLTERLSRPVVVICVADGIGRGSCRSVDGFSIHAALESRSEMLLAFGGHEMAAGLTIERDRIDELKRSLSEADMGETPGARLWIDLEVIKPGLLTTENVEALSGLEPFGNGNPLPVLCLKNALIESAMPIGKGKHSKFRIHKNGETFDGVLFGRSPKELGVSAGDAADVAFTPQINEYRGRRSVQLHLTDIRPAAEVLP